MSTPAEDCRWHGLVLDPLDVLFFRDGRPFDAANRVVSGLPAPQTVAGAVRTALLSAAGCRPNALPHGTGAMVDRLRQAGADEAILTAAFRGPWLASWHGEDGHPVEPLFACPMNLRPSRDDQSLYRIGRPRDLTTSPLNGWNSASGLWPVEYDGELNPKPDPILLTLRGLRRFLDVSGTSTSITLTAGVDYRSADETHALDHRTGIGIDPGRLSTIRGELYGIGLLALVPDIRLYVEVCLPQRLADCLHSSALPLGGEGRAVRITVTAPCDELSAKTATRPAGRTFSYLATPAFLPPAKDGRPLPRVRGGRLVGAVSDRGVGISGWDVVRGGPRATRFAVPAGAVYFLEGDSAGDEATIDWEAGGTDAALRQEGWGVSIRGQWS